MLPTRQVNRLLHKARDESVARVVFVGDQRQHHAIEAGRPIFQMQEAGMLIARLDTIRRQRDPELREAVTLASKGEIAESLAILERRGDIREVADIEQRRKQIAREYVAAYESGQRVLVVSPANDERRELNRAIRSELIVRGHISFVGNEHTILVNRGLSGAQRATAYNYEEGDVIRFTRGSKQFAITKGDYARVEAVDREANLLTVGCRTGGASNTILCGSSASKSSAKSNAPSHKATGYSSAHPIDTLGLANGEFATIDSIDDRRALLRLDNGSQLSAALDRLATSIMATPPRRTPAQGATVDHVIVNIDTALSLELVNRKQFYVSISRARNALTIFTDDRSTAQDRAVDRTREKSVAMEHQIGVPHSAFTVLPDEQRHTLNRGHGMRR